MSSITRPSGGYPNNIGYSPQNVAQPANTLQEFSEKLYSLDRNFNGFGREPNNNFLVGQLYNIYAKHRDSNNNHLNEELSTLIDTWIKNRPIEKSRIADGNRIIQLLNNKYTTVQNAKEQLDAAKKNVSKPAPTPPKPAPPKPAHPKPAEQQPRKANALLKDLHRLLNKIYQNTPNAEEELFNYYRSLSEDDCTKLTEKPGLLLPQDVLDKILAYCCSKNDDLNPDPLSSVLNNLHTKFKDISAANSLSLYENELIRIMAGIQNVHDGTGIRDLKDSLAKFKIILGNTIDQERLTELANHNLVKVFETPEITLTDARKRWEKLQSDIIAADIKLDDNNRLELPDDWRGSIATITKHVSGLQNQKIRLFRLSDDSLCSIVDFCLVEQSDIRQNNLIALLTIFHDIFGPIPIEQELIRAMKEIKRFPKKDTIKIIGLDDAIHKFTSILDFEIEQTRLIELGKRTGDPSTNNTIYLKLQNKYNKKPS